MKLVIAGGRDLVRAPEQIDLYMAYIGLPRPELVISGACLRPDDEYELIKDKDGNWIYAAGIDGSGERWATEKGIAIKRYPAQFKTLGRPAGPRRNLEMAKACDAVLLVWDGKSRGSRSMLELAEKQGKPVFQILYDISIIDVIEKRSQDGTIHK